MLGLALGGAAAAQGPPPAQPFESVHLVTLSAAEEASLLAFIADLNAATTEAGHPEVRFRLYKVAGTQQGSYSHMWDASWPSGAVYDEIYAHPAWIAATARHIAVVGPFQKKQVYNRYVEVMPAKP